ncbi:MAG: hypothetical protein WBC06_12385 [Chitinophagaceae bacterium]
MKKILLIAAIYFTGNNCLAQFTTNLIVTPQPPGSLLNWGTKDLTYIVSSPGGATRQVVIKATLKTPDGTAATTNLAKARIITLGSGNLIFYAADVIPLTAMVFSGKYKTSMDKTGKLPADNYQLCVQLVTPTDYIPVSEERCRSFTLASFQLPIPVSPANEEVMDAIKAQTAITFRWTPVTPRPSEPVRYIVTVFEVLEKQTPMQALRSNQPLLTKEVMGTTQFIWQPQLSFMSKEKPADTVKIHISGDPHVSEKLAMDSIGATTFIWTIQTTDSRGVPFGDGNINGDGISEPNFFTIISDRRKNPKGPPAKVLYMNSRN